MKAFQIYRTPYTAYKNNSKRPPLFITQYMIEELGLKLFLFRNKQHMKKIRETTWVIFLNGVLSGHNNL